MKKSNPSNLEKTYSTINILTHVKAIKLCAQIKFLIYRYLLFLIGTSFLISLAMHCHYQKNAFLYLLGNTKKTFQQQEIHLKNL